MNIFVLDKDPYKAASYHCDKHVVKMIVESAQILCTVLHKKNFTKEPIPYKPTHQNHPCVLWAEQSFKNFLWLQELLDGLLNQYTNRYKKFHKTELVQKFLLTNLCEIKFKLNWQLNELTPFALAMPNEYKTDNAVQSYRNYYMGAKRDICKWKNEKPWWFE